MKTWLAPLALGILAIGATALVVAGPPGGPPSASAAARGADYVPGLKRAPGTWQDTAMTVGQDGLGSPDVTIDVQLVRPVFNPSQIRVKQGQVVRLRLRALDNGLADMPELKGAVGLKEFSGHGFQIMGPYDVWVTGVRKGEVKDVTFKATVAGEFPFECTVFCSPNHYVMQGKLIVEPQ